MATIHRTTMVPTKLELLRDWLPRQPWYRGTGAQPQLVRSGGFRLDDPAGEVGIEFIVVTDADGSAYSAPLAYRSAALPEAEEGMLGTSEHGVLGRRWIYDAAYDPVAVAQLLAFFRGEAEAQHQDDSDTPEPSVGRSWTGDGLPPAVEPLQVAHASDRTTVALTDQRSLDLVRVLQEGAHDVENCLGHLAADWTRPDGSVARGPVAVVR
jgi:hypothetical protein